MITIQKKQRVITSKEFETATELQDYVNEVFRFDAELNENLHLWQLIRTVRIFVPAFKSQLPSAITLIDVPGIGDTEPLRQQRTASIVKNNLDMVWILGKRFASSKTSKDVIMIPFHLHLIMSLFYQTM